MHRATDAPYVRQEISLLAAFPKMPRVEIPAATATKGPRLFELRTYENPSEKAQRAKIRMFSDMGEIEIFRRCRPDTGVLFTHDRRTAHAQHYVHARA